MDAKKGEKFIQETPRPSVRDTTESGDRRATHH
jgi:hypothetical protein